MVRAAARKLTCRLRAKAEKSEAARGQNDDLKTMSVYTILLIILIILLIGALPTWPYSNGWGYYPSGGLGLIVVILLILVLLGKV